MKNLAANRNHKDGVFKVLFSDKEKLLELYNAVSGSSYGKDADIKITTLSNTIFKGRANDISFVIDGKIVVLIEHQSSINENMPLRMLIYAAKLYDKMTKRRDLYREKKISIPRPEFIVLYNGAKPCPDHQRIRLSDMFAEPAPEGLAGLELVVDVYNINKGRNEEFALRSKMLSDYETFVYLAREHGKSMSMGSAIELAVRECISGGVLREFLEEHSSEIKDMSILFCESWDWDEAKDVWQEEAREEGIAIGEARGVALGEAQALSRMKYLLGQGLSGEEILRRIGEK